MSEELNGRVKGQPGARWAIMRRFAVGKDGSLYLFRLRIVQTPWFGVYLHHIARQDLDRDPHDHPWSFGALILRGGYVEEFHPFPHVGRDLQMRCREWVRGSWHTIDRSQAHRIVTVQPNTWTLVLVGRRRRDWGFFTPDGWVQWREYLDNAEAATTASGTSRTWSS